VPIGSIRRYDVQATYSLALSFISLIPFVAAAWLFLRNLHWDLHQVIYNSRGPFLPIFLACAMLAMLSAALGFVLGWNSAGQRRNDRPGQSWTGFFLGGIIVTLDLILLIAFFMLRLQRTL